jgi:2-dehydro-3-deoxyphosphogluconate aldolase/(4S)-4-hydroxy-2-oxoglutarate aldolase
MLLAETLASVRIVPVVTVRSAAHAVPLARALAAGGLTVLEITLRTDAAIESIRRIAEEVEGVVAGAGTVLNVGDLARAQEAGAKFAVSPGFSRAVAEAARERGIPLLAGVATATEVMQGLEAGLSLFKFFPAETVGGEAALRAFAGPFPAVRFCPTGGITMANLSRYIALPNVTAIGGSWMIPADFSPERDGARVTASARDAIMAAWA